MNLPGCDLMGLATIFGGSKTLACVTKSSMGGDLQA
jgi:hypothetical protein